MTGRLLRRWLRRSRTRWALAVLIPILVAALAAPLYPRSPTDQDLRGTLAPPGTVSAAGTFYPLGTDELGRDLASRLLHGTRASVAVGASTTVLILTLGLTGWVSFAKLVRAKTFELRSEEFVQAAHALGVRSAGALGRHVLPNVMPLLPVDGTLQFGALVLAEAGLSFLGLGVPPPTPTLGGVLAGGQVFLAVAWWISTFPGLLLLTLVLVVNVLGDTLRDAAAPGG